MRKDSVDKICKEFESAWRAGRQPRLEKQLDAVEGPVRAALLQELLTLEVQIRRQAGEQPTYSEYRERFPADGDVVERVFAGEADPATYETIDLKPAHGHPADTNGDDAGLTIRCPHCHTPREVVDENLFQDMSCTSCGSSFSLIDGESTPTADRPTVRRVGHFELIEQLGVGAFGSVWKARDTELDRVVAIKIPRKDQLDSGEIEQFFREARAAAQLRHPNIVSVHEVGRDGSSIFIVSDLVRGVTLSDWLSGQRPTPRESAEICAKVGEALQHAHHKGVIHRDLKPGNIMLDADGEPHIMDFGLAKREAGEVTMTVEGRVLGTPAYMSPEQARGEGHQVDPRTDVYSLGVILFQMLTSELPFRGTPRMLLHQVLNEEPRAPRGLNDRVPRDLETICLKAMAKDPARRFSTVHAMAGDLRRYLAGEPIHARPVGRIERGWRWANRNRSLAALGGTLFGVLLLVAVGSSLVAVLMGRLATSEKLSASRAHEAEQAARKAAAQELTEKQRAELSARQANVALEQSERDRQLAELREDEARHNQYLARISQAQTAWRAGNVASVLELLDRLEPADGENDLRGPEFYRLLDDCHRDSRTFRGHLLAVRDIMFSPSGDKLWSVSEDGTIRAWGLATREQDLIYPVNYAIYRCAALSPDGSLLILGLGGTAVLIDPRTKQKLGGHRQLHEDLITSMAFSPNGNKLLSTSESGAARLWSVPALLSLADSDAPKPEHSWKVPAGGVLGSFSSTFCCRISPDGKTAAVGAGARLMMGNGEVRLWDCESGQAKPPLKGHQGAVYSLAFSPDGSRLATASADRTWQLWDLSNNQSVLKKPFHKGSVNSLDISPDGKQLVTGSTDRSVAIWDLQSGNLARSFTGHTDTVSSVRFSPDGRSVASSSGDTTLRIWNLDATDGSVTISGQSAEKPSSEGRSSLLGSGTGVASLRIVTSIDFTTDGKHMIVAVWSAARKGRIEIWDTATRQLTRTIEAPHSGFVRCALAPGNRRIAIAAGGFPFGNLMQGKARLAIYDLDSAEKLAGWEVGSPLVWSLAFSPDGSTLVCGEPNGLLEVWDPGSGRKLMEDRFPANHVVTALAFTADGRLGAAGTTEGITRLYDLATGRSVGELPLQTSGVFALAFSPDGKTLAAGTAKSPFENVNALADIIFFDVEQKTEAKKISGLMLGVMAVDWTRDGRRLLATTADGASKLFDTRSGTELLTIESKDPLSFFSCLSPDDQFMTVGGMPGVHLHNFRLSTESQIAWHERHAAQAVEAGDWPKVVKNLDAVIGLDPRNPVLYYQKARAHWELGQTDQMNETWQRIATFGDANYLRPYASAWVVSMYVEARLWKIRGNNPRMVRAYEIVELLMRAVQLDKTAEMAGILWHLGDAHHYYTRDHDKAISYYREVLAVQRALSGTADLDAVWRLHELAQELRGENRYVEAEEIYREIVDACPVIYPNQMWEQFVMTWTLGETLRDSGHPADAEPYFREALQGFRSLAPTAYTVFTIASVEEELADVLRRQGKPIEPFTMVKSEGEVPLPLAAAEFPSLDGLLSSDAGQGLVMQVHAGAEVLATQRSAQIDACWGLEPPGDSLPADNFFIRWTGWLKPARPGRTQLVTLSDDRVRLWVDGNLLVNDWSGRWINRSVVEFELDAEPVPIQLDFQDDQHNANVSLRWIPPGEVQEVVIPASAFFLSEEKALAASSSPPGNRLAHGLRRELFRGLDFQSLVSSDEDAEIDEWWRYDGPSLAAPANFFSIRWTGTIQAPTAGRYRLITYADDNARVWVDDELVIDAWSGDQPTRKSGEVSLTGSPQTLRVEYKEATLMAFMSLRWSREGADEEVVPASALGPPPSR